MERRYFMKREDLKPHVYWMLKEDTVEMTLRFIVREGKPAGEGPAESRFR